MLIELYYKIRAKTLWLIRKPGFIFNQWKLGIKYRKMLSNHKYGDNARWLDENFDNHDMKGGNKEDMIFDMQRKMRIRYAMKIKHLYPEENSTIPRKKCVPSKVKFDKVKLTR